MTIAIITGVICTVIGFIAGSRFASAIGRAALEKKELEAFNYRTHAETRFGELERQLDSVRDHHYSSARGLNERLNILEKRGKKK